MPVFHHKPILVPTDYSDASLQAVEIAKSIAGSDKEVTLVHVAVDMDLTLHPLSWSGGPLPNYSLDRLLLVLKEWSGKHDVGEINLAVRKGDPGTEICELAKETGCQLIVVPSHGRHGVSRLLLGSVAERIIRHCHCSVLVLHRAKETETVVEGVDWFPPQRVVVPIDFSEASSVAITTALEITKKRDQIDVVSVIPAMDDAVLFGVAGTPENERREDCQQHMVKYLADHGHGTLQTHALVGDAGTAIVQHASATNADLIVIPTHGRHGLKRLALGSTTERVIRHSEVPVLVLRSTPD